VALAALALDAAACLPERVTAGQCLDDTGCAADQHCVAPVCTDCVTTPHGTCAAGARCHGDGECPASAHCGPDAFCIPGPRCAAEASICASSPAQTTYCQAAARESAPYCQTAATAETCRALSPALVAAEGACVPSDACGSGCRAGEVCLDGQCRGDPLCGSDADCGLGRVCARGECFFRCDQGEACPDLTRCAVGSCEWLPALDGPCARGELYFAGRCRTVCNSDRDCASGFYCDDGLCRLDARTAAARPAPACATDQDCASTSRCVGGGCRATCPSGSDAECQRADVALAHCDAQHICRP
jgi:hypothetical protein